MKTKKIVSMFLTFAIMTASVLTAFAAPVGYGEELSSAPTKTYSQKFNDVKKTHWAFSYIGEMSERGVLNGYPNGNFYPENNVTRGEFAKIMTLAAGLTIPKSASSSYTDVDDDDWYCPYIETARYYLSGYVTNGRSYYLPESNALREDIAVALVKLKGYDTTGYDESILKAMFTDWQSISTSARKYVAVAVEQGLVSGYDDDTFRGQGAVTRAETATLLWRAYQYGNGNKDFEQSNLEKEDINPPVNNNNNKEDVTPIKPEQPEPEVINEYTVSFVVDDEVIEEIVMNEGETLKTKEFPKIPEKEGYESSWSVTKDIKNISKDITVTAIYDEIEVVEPEKEYGWKVTTIKNGIDDIDYMLTVPNGVSYSLGNKVYELNDRGSLKTIFDADKFPFAGEGAAKTPENRLESYGYNKYDDCYYDLIFQSPTSSPQVTEYPQLGDFIIYNITNDEIISKIPYNYGRPNHFAGGVDMWSSYEETIYGLDDHYYMGLNGVYEVSRLPSFKFYKNGDIEFNEGRISPSGRILTESHSSYDSHRACKGLIDSDYTKQYAYNSDTKEIYSFDRSDLSIYEDKRCDDFNEGQFLLSFDDIENEEERTINSNHVIYNGAITDDETGIYFLDSAYGSIRKIEKIN